MSIFISSCENKVKSVVEDKPTSPITKKSNLQISMDRGGIIYTNFCAQCHLNNGKGIPNTFPPLAKSDYLNADVNRAISIVVKGKTGEITVNGAKYNSVMTRQAISNEDVADVLTYIYNSWGNNKTNVTTSQVNQVKSGH